MSNKTTKKEAPKGRLKPDPDWDCEGRYMEPGTPWEESPGLCADHCPDNLACWKKRKARKEKECSTK